MGIGVNVDVMQTLIPEAETGAKSFGGIPNIQNPNAKNKNELVFIIGIGAAVTLFFLFIRGKK